MKLSQSIAEMISRKKKRPLIVLIDGGTSSGKSYFLSELLEDLDGMSINHMVIEVDDYLISRKKRKSLGKDYYDLKKWFRLDMLARNLKEIEEGTDEIEKPQYDHSTGKENDHHVLKIDRHAVIFVCGIFSFDVGAFSDLKILIDADAGVRLEREAIRNKEKRNVPEEETVKRFREVLDPTYQKHYMLVKDDADIVVDNNDWDNRKVIFRKT